MQAKLVVGNSNDPLEQEADRVADEVTRIPNLGLSITDMPLRVSRKCAACEQEEAKTLQLKRTAPSNAANGVPSIVYEILRSTGQPLDPETRSFFKRRFGRDFSQVRIHTDERAAVSAHVVGALAYTAGSHIVFGTNSYSPQSWTGRRLLAHELVHVAQQAEESQPAHRGRSQNMVRVHTEARVPESARGVSAHERLWGRGSETRQDVTPLPINPSAGAPIRKPVYESSGTCTVETSESNCFPDAGGYIIGPVRNDCVTEPCTREHERVHVRELDGCCKAYIRALKRPGADALAVTQMWEAWKEQARPITECHAYMNDVACAQRLAQQRGCVPEASEEGASDRLAAAVETGTDSGSGAGVEGFAQDVFPSATKRLRGVKGLTADCIDIVWYQQTFGDKAAELCSGADGRLFPPCPFK
jgi:hypothetical protein